MLAVRLALALALAASSAACSTGTAPRARGTVPTATVPTAYSAAYPAAPPNLILGVQ